MYLPHICAVVFVILTLEAEAVNIEHYLIDVDGNLTKQKYEDIRKLPLDEGLFYLSIHTFFE